MTSPNQTVGLKIKDIEGCLVEKKDCTCGPKTECVCDLGEIVGRNNCIDEQGLVSITLNREKLAKLIFSNISIDEKNYGEIKSYGVDVAWSRLPKWHKDFFTGVAGIIISELKNIVEVVK